MAKNPFDVLRAQETQPLPDTYVDGIGFLPGNRKYATTLGIRRMANLFCIAVLLYFVLQNFLKVPMTFFAYFIGADIEINHYTGLIVVSKQLKEVIVLFSNIVALFCICLFCGCVYYRCYRASGIFRKPHRGITSIAVPIVMALYLFGIFLGVIEGYIGKSIGFVFPFSLRPLSSVASISVIEILATIVFVILQEMFFRGIVLTPLRRYGDGFAIISASLIASLWSGGFLEFLPTFLFSLPLCYFVIRSGSIVTAIIARLCCEGIVMLLRICNTTLETSLSNLIMLLTMLLVVMFAVFAFITFIRLDHSAFHIIKSKDGIKTSYKLFTVVGSISFLALVVFLLIRVVDVMQIIG